MKMYFLFSDVVLMGLISSFTTLAVLILTALINARVKRYDIKRGEEIKMYDARRGAEIARLEKKQDDNAKTMDGHMSNLLEKTAELNKEIGYKERKAEQAPIIEQKVKDAEELGKLKGKEELRDQIKNGEQPEQQKPTETIIVENKDKEVIITKNLDK